jgi:hypothetical protein
MRGMEGGLKSVTAGYELILDLQRMFKYRDKSISPGRPNVLIYAPWTKAGKRRISTWSVLVFLFDEERRQGPRQLVGQLFRLLRNSMFLE